MKKVLLIMLFIGTFFLFTRIGFFFGPLIFGPKLFPDVPKNLGECIQEYNESMKSKLQELETTPKENWASDKERCDDWIRTIKQLEDCKINALVGKNGAIYPERFIPLKVKHFFNETQETYESVCR